MRRIDICPLKKYFGGQEWSRFRLSNGSDRPEMFLGAEKKMRLGVENQGGRACRGGLRAGVTLIELMVVATIILAVTAISVPVLKPMLKSQVTRNAVTTVSTYLNRARTRAMTTGRPCGVTFEYWTGSELNGGSASLVLRQVEVPPNFTGLTSNEKVSVDRLDAFWNNTTGTSQCPVVFESGVTFPYFDGSRIQFDGIGPWFTMKEEPKDSGAFVIEEIPGVEFPAKFNVPFKIVRRGSKGWKPTMTAPIGLPQGTVVDLEFSGTDDSLCLAGTTLDGAGNEVSLAQDMTIVFAPGGEVDRIVGLSSGQEIISRPIYLLIGRWERIAALVSTENPNETNPELNPTALSSADDGLWNFEDASNFWLSINPNTGSVMSAEVNPVLVPGATFEEKLYNSREFARDVQFNVGGF